MKIGNLEISTYKESSNKQPIIQNLLRSITLADGDWISGYKLPSYNPDKLYAKHGNYDLFDEMREDDQISAVLNLIKYIILGAEWDIDCEHEQAKEFIIDNFNALDEIFIKKLYNILSAIDFGFSLTEIVFKIEENKINLDRLITRSPEGFDFIQDEYGNITEIKQSVWGKELYINPDKFIRFSYQEEFDNPYGRSAMNQGVYRAYWSKNAIIKFWNIYLERHGMPFVVATYPKGNLSARDNIDKILKNLQAKTGVSVPEGYEFDLKEAAKGTDNYEKAIDKYNMMIARSMLVPDLLGFSGSGIEGGSYALGEKQFEMFYTIINFIRKQLSRIITQKLVKPLVLYNFGDIEAEFSFIEIDEQKKNEMLKLWLESIISGKIPITDNHINWFLQNVDAPEIEQKELDEINKQKEEMRDAIQNKDKEEQEKEDEGSERQKNEKEKSDKFVRYSQYDRKVDYKKIESEMDSVEDKYRKDFQGIYKLMINGLVDEIKRKRIIERKRFDLISKLDLRYQTKAERLYKNMVKEAYGLGRGSVKTYIVDDTLVLNDDQIASWIDAYAYEFSAKKTESILSTVRPIVSEGIRSGAGVKEIVKMIDDALGGYDKMEIETIVRTVTSTGYNQGRLQQFGSIQDQIQAYEFSAILDGRTSPLCEKLGSPGSNILKPNEVNKYNPPLHFNCRSLLIPIFKDEEFDGDFNIPEVKETQGNFVELI